ncbi:Hsp20/alpha crystallin family protein [Bacillus massilinigeriensis]|uniref:Hsp20/alpha crystallin family protein n=1 Tax=Bacillus mediterraneensis TaxID=1805474 RepID=UPI0008F8ED02|nr:Hsp20/alpha crystallin family protein [Bacillus mediterraneensis]
MEDKFHNSKKRETKLLDSVFGSMSNLLNEKQLRGFLQTMDDFFQKPIGQQFPFHSYVEETEDGYKVSVELPGIRKQQIKMEVFSSRLSIHVHDLKSERLSNSKHNVYYRKDSLKNTSKTVTFSEPVDRAGTTAQFRNGLLEINVPKQKGKSIIIHNDNKQA